MAESHNKIPFPADASERADKLYSEGAVDQAVADHFGVSRQIIYLWRSRDDKFDAACERGKQVGEAIRVQAIHDQVSGERPDLQKQPPLNAADTVGKLCALGHTDFEVAGFLGTTTTVMRRWKAEHPEIAEAFKTGKEIANERVERSLYSRATGYSYDAIKIFNYKGSITKVPYVEHAAPDTVACIFWLKNRRPEAWRDRREVVATSPDGKNLNDLSSDELDRQVVEALRRAQESERRISEATGGAGGPEEGKNRPADIRKYN